MTNTESRNRRLIRELARMDVTEAEEVSCVVAFYAMTPQEQELYLQILEE